MVNETESDSEEEIATDSDASVPEIAMQEAMEKRLERAMEKKRQVKRKQLRSAAGIKSKKGKK